MTNQEHNNSAKGVVHPENKDLLIAEYNALREETLKRFEIGYQLIALTLTAAGIILTIGLQTKNAPILLIYPILTLFLSAVWTNNESNIANLAIYIRENIEPRTAENAMGWEHRREHKVAQTLMGFQKVTTAGSGAIFISTELLATLIGLTVATFNLTEKVLLALDILSILLSTVLFILLTMRWRLLVTKETKRQMSSSEMLHQKTTNRPE